MTFALAAAACSNSDETTTDGGATTPTAASSVTTAPTDSGSATTAAASDRDVFVPISGVPGVSDDEIGFAVIGTRSNNPLGTCILDCYLDGIKAYFDFRNSEGGIYGRNLVVNQELDDELGANQARALEVISNDDSFGVFNAALVSSGWGDLENAGIPTYVWGIQAADEANRPHIFPSTAQLCFDCTSHLMPYAVKQAGATKVATIGYGASENSKVCTSAAQASVERYSADIGAEVVYFNDNLAFGLPSGIGPEVSAMKDAGVDFISTCIDLNGMKTLAQELHRQGMDDVTLYHPNTYNQQFVAEADPLFEGDFVSVSFLPFEADTAGSTLGDFLTWMEKAGKVPTELAMTGWINASVAFEGLLAAGPEFDRQKVTDATNALTADTAGGLMRPTNWSTAHTPYTDDTRPADRQGECVMAVRVENGKFVTVAPPDTPWLCWSSTDWAEPEFTSFN